jgi:hypothetical protein
MRDISLRDDGSLIPAESRRLVATACNAAEKMSFLFWDECRGWWSQTWKFTLRVRGVVDRGPSVSRISIARGWSELIIQSFALKRFVYIVPWRSMEGAFRAWGMTGIETTQSESLTLVCSFGL